MEVDVEMLKEEMLKQNLNINNLADKSGVDKSTISRLLDGRICSVGTAQKIAQALNFSSKKAGLIFFSHKLQKRNN